jgi:hypothetical protein
MNYWVRERPPGRLENAEHFVVLYGDKGCSQGVLPFMFDEWEVAQALANALQNNPPTREQIRIHEGDYE